MKRLIVNADDFGFTRDVNAGIVHAHRSGILTSTTLMANGDAFEDAVRLAREIPTLDIGCHLTLVQGRALTTGVELPDGPRQLLPVLARRELDVYAELRAQIEKIIAAGIRPTHLDSHKHTHILPNVFRALVRLAAEFRIPYVRLPLDTTLPFSSVPRALADRFYRSLGRKSGVRMTDHFLGFRLTGTLTEDTLIAALSRLKDGTTEFMCHPGFLDAELGNAKTRLKASRVRELEALTSPRVREFIEKENIVVRPFEME